MRRKLSALRSWIRDYVPPPWIRATMTAASRITTPTYPALYTAAGLLFIFQAPSRTSSEAFDVARMLFEIPTWGCLFLAVGLLEAGALVGGYAGAVWHTDDQSSGVTYVVSIQVAYAASCAWRVAQLSRRMRWVRRLLLQHGLLEL